MAWRVGASSSFHDTLIPHSPPDLVPRDTAQPMTGVIADPVMWLLGRLCKLLPVYSGSTIVQSCLRCHIMPLRPNPTPYTRQYSWKGPRWLGCYFDIRLNLAPLSKLQNLMAQLTWRVKQILSSPGDLTDPPSPPEVRSTATKNGVKTTPQQG